MEPEQTILLADNSGPILWRIAADGYMVQEWATQPFAIVEGSQT